MNKKKIFGLTITALLFIGVMFSANGYHELIKTWEGPAHEHCGHDASIPSVNGTLMLSINETGNLAPYQAFEIIMEVKNFTEVLGDPYYSYMMLGLPGVGAEGVDIDNDKFSLPLGEKLLARKRKVDAYGSYDESTSTRSSTDCLFVLLAPGQAGTYDLMGLSIAGFNQTSTNFYANVTNDMEMNITYIEEIIQITVVGAAPGDGGSIPGFITLALISTIGVSVFAVALKVRRKKRILE